MAPIKAKWSRLASSEGIKRSSQVLGVLRDNLVIYSGELKPRQPVDNKVYTIPLTAGQADVTTIDATAESDTAAAEPRVGSASTTVGQTLYLFSGRGGPSMKPLDEAGALWSLSLSPSPPSSAQWSLLKPSSPDAPVPQPRSYHAMTTDGASTVYLHAGCPSTGRLSDLWAFNLQERSWTRLADAPTPPRGGTSIAFAKMSGDEGRGKLYRMNGFDGQTEQGGAIDVYDIAADSWTTVKFAADGVEGPEARSVGCLLAVEVSGRECLVTFGGERDPSSLGHEGAGKMLGDAWVWDLRDGGWREVEVGGEGPSPRGWFAADVFREGEKDAVVVHGGLGEDNERLDDVWVLRF